MTTSSAETTVWKQLGPSARIPLAPWIAAPRPSRCPISHWAIPVVPQSRIHPNLCRISTSFEKAYPILEERFHHDEFRRGKRHRQSRTRSARPSLFTVSSGCARTSRLMRILMANVRTYMHGCGFSVAVFDRIESDSLNPNVALKVGYMLSLGKRVCLLKDQTLNQTPTDMMGSLYADLDLDDVDVSVQNVLQRWLRQCRNQARTIADDLNRRPPAVLSLTKALPDGAASRYNPQSRSCTVAPRFSQHVLAGWRCTGAIKRLDCLHALGDKTLVR